MQLAVTLSNPKISVNMQVLFARAQMNRCKPVTHTDGNNQDFECEAKGQMS